MELITFNITVSVNADPKVAADFIQAVKGLIQPITENKEEPIPCELYAARMGVSVSVVRRWAREGKIKSEKRGGRVWVEPIKLKAA